DLASSESRKTGADLSGYAGGAGVGSGQPRSFVEKWICESLSTRYRSRSTHGVESLKTGPITPSTLSPPEANPAQRSGFRRELAWEHHGGTGARQILR